LRKGRKKPQTSWRKAKERIATEEKRRKKMRVKGPRGVQLYM